MGRVSNIDAVLRSVTGAETAPKTITEEQAAAVLGCSSSAIGHMAASGLLVRVGEESVSTGSVMAAFFKLPKEEK